MIKRSKEFKTMKEEIISGLVWLSPITDQDHEREIIMEVESKMPEINLTGQVKTNYPRFVVDQDYYQGLVRSVSDVYTRPDPSDDKKTQERLNIRVALGGFKPEDVKKACSNYDELEDKPTEVTFTLFLNNKVSKGYGKYSPSTLYNILERAGLLSKLTEDHESNELFVEFLRKELVGKKVKLNVVKKKDSDGKWFSRASELVSFS